MKEQIQIPFNLGRTMFGVVDESGLLQYGQVFIQYTSDVEMKTPGKNAAKEILKGGPVKRLDLSRRFVSLHGL